MISVHQTATPVGEFTWLRRDGAVVASGWTTDAERLARLARLTEPLEVGEDDPATAAAIASHFDGDRNALARARIEQHSTPFMEAGWRALRRIPFGHTLSYAELAAEAGRPRAVRAAAHACATNRCALFVPCHRVVRSDGGLGGFGWGLHVKRALLEWEHSAVG